MHVLCTGQVLYMYLFICNTLPRFPNIVSVEIYNCTGVEEIGIFLMGIEIDLSINYYDMKIYFYVISVDRDLKKKKNIEYNFSLSGSLSSWTLPLQELTVEPHHKALSCKSICGVLE